MSKWVKNTDTASRTWVGQTVLASEYYELQTHEIAAWANNSLLLTDIGSGIAVVAEDNSGTSDIADVNTAINFLKDGLPFPK